MLYSTCGHNEVLETEESWHDFLGRMQGYNIKQIVTRFWDKVVVLYCVRDLSWHTSDNYDTVLTGSGHYISIHCSFFKRASRERNLGNQRR